MLDAPFGAAPRLALGMHLLALVACLVNLSGYISVGLNDDEPGCLWGGPRTT